MRVQSKEGSHLVSLAKDCFIKGVMEAESLIIRNERTLMHHFSFDRWGGWGQKEEKMPEVILQK